jgi:PAS domain S-box-containing protein
MQEKLDSKEIYRKLFSSSSDAILILDVESNKFVDVNDSAIALYGYSHAEFLNLSLRDISAEPKNNEKAIKENLNEGLTKTPYRLHKNKEGEILQVELTAGTFKSNDRSFIYALVRDISERKKHERELLISKKIWDILQSTQSLSISHAHSKIIFDKVLDDLLEITSGEYGFIGEVLYGEEGQPYLKTKAITNIAWNSKTEKLYSSQKELGLEFHNLDTLFGKVLTTGEKVISNDPINDPRGGGLPIGHPEMHSFLGIPIRFGGELIGMVGLANKPDGYFESDIKKIEPYLDSCSTVLEAYRGYEQRIEAEKNLKNAYEAIKLSNKELSTFASITSHDLKNPLRRIVNYCAFIEGEEAELSDITKQYVNKIELAAYHANNLIEGILEYSQLGMDKTPHKVIDLKEIVSITIENLEFELLETKGKVDFGNLPSVFGSEFQIRQLFENLISNSLKYRRMDVPPNIKISHHETNRDHVQIILEDNGIGFDNVYAKKIFDPFQRLDGDISILGSGLGLSICKKIMLSHLGGIIAEGEVNRGARFVITFPFKEEG